jgi:hypothetical protein
MRTSFRSALLLALVTTPLAAACGPGGRNNDDPCIGEECEGTCSPGETGACYSGTEDTLGVGPCHAGERTCGDDGEWGPCVGEQIPTAEQCGNGIDENCTGQADEDTDLDGDGYSTCDGDCCDSIECSDPELANPGAFEADGNFFDDDCDGMVDELQPACDSGLASSSTSAADYAKAMDICQDASGGSWGLVSASFSLLGNGSPHGEGHSIRAGYGTNMAPQAGASLALLSTGAAADLDDSSPSFVHPGNGDALLETGLQAGTSAAFPSDWLAAHAGSLPNAPGCPEPLGSEAFNPVMLTLELKVPTNARSFAVSTNFLSAEYPEWVCSAFNDFFIVLLDSSYSSNDPANPADKNLATYTAPDESQYPVGVNLAYGNTGLFRQCQNGATGCGFNAVPGNQTTCESTDELAGTGLDGDGSDFCDSGSDVGGGTGWLTTRGNVVPGETITLRFAIWDTSDELLDSTVVLDNFRWSVDPTEAGTDID